MYLDKAPERTENKPALSDKKKRLELKIALVITLFAAVAAVNGLYGGKYGDDEMICHNKESQMAAWYQAKSTKQILAENQRDMLRGFVVSELLPAERSLVLDSVILNLNQEIKRYKKEKTEILLGSATVGPQNWAQDLEGEMGKIKGVKEYQQKAEVLGKAGDNFDKGALLLNLCLVFGAVALIVESLGIKKILLWLLFALGSLGAYFTTLAYLEALPIVV
ncbi:MAG: DUF4337 domain-containing protein [Microscillaceae bacterium]|nr:DUF4337 domain-containing protein [Microscillaceae bacterium]